MQALIKKRKKLLDKKVKKIIKGFQKMGASKIILFGSYSKGHDRLKH